MVQFRRHGIRFPIFALAATALIGCAELDVTNPNAPDRSRAVRDIETAEALISGAFNGWHGAQYSFAGMGVGLSAASFQHSTPFCQGSGFSILPRQTSPAAGSGYHPYTTRPWDDLYRVLASVADGLGSLDASPELWAALDADEAARLQAFARFVQGLGHGGLALLYDRSVIRDEMSELEGPATVVGYDVVMDTALAFLAQAAALARGGEWTIPAGWMSVPVTADQLARLTHSYAARFRAAVARTPEERAAVDWNAVIADVDAGITASWVMDMDYYDGWYNPVADYTSYPGWSDEAYFIIGMADQSGNYQRWLDMPLRERRPEADLRTPGDQDPVLIVTPDTRFPRGSTLDEQKASPGSLYAIPDGLEGQIDGRDRAWGIRNVWARADRGTWRWSYYWHIDTEAYTYWVDFQWPEIPLAEMRLLKAEGLLRLGDAASAASLVNTSRVPAGLSPTDAAGTNPECVPRLPDRSCGDLMEMLKWEKRLETHMKGLFGAPWYFDGRGWGDLYAGTFLQLPIPCDEVRLLGMDTGCYTFGGPGGESAAAPSGYGWPDER